MKLLLSFAIVLTFSVVPEISQAANGVMRPGAVPCCTAKIRKSGGVCDTTCNDSGRSTRGIKNRGNVPCCDTPGLNPNWQCNTSCSAFDSRVRRCNDAMRRAGRCE